MLKTLIGAILVFAQKNPAVVSWVLTVAAGAAAHYGLHVTPAQLVGVIAVVGTILHAWLHVQTKKA